MTRKSDLTDGERWNRWRMAGWAALVALVMLVPFVAMQFTDDVVWSVGDFVFAGVLVSAVGIIFEIAIRMTVNSAYRIAVGVALAAAFLLIWLTGAVGIIGTEDHGANLLYGAVLLIAVLGAILARFEPEGMSRAFLGAAVLQVSIGLLALAARWGSADPTWPRDVIGLTVFFAAMWLTSASLLRKAALEQDRSGAAA